VLISFLAFDFLFANHVSLYSVCNAYLRLAVVEKQLTVFPKSQKRPSFSDSFAAIPKSIFADKVVYFIHKPNKLVLTTISTLLRR